MLWPAHRGCQPPPPVRVLDTRNGTGGYTGPFTNQSTHTITLSGAPAGALMVVGNVTSTGSTHSGFVTLWPSGAQPATSSLNYAAGATVANGVQVALSGGTMQAFVSNTTYVIFDVTGYVLPVSNVVRLLDTGQSCAAGETAATWKQIPAFVSQFGSGNIPDGNVGANASGVCSNMALGQAWLFPGQLAPAGTHVADGSLLQISSNQALFSLYGTLYGGDGQTTFGIPDLRAFAPNHVSYVVCLAGIYPSH
ncbi:MAG: tail fiber protein [Actinomycetota bacterium]|nr:tail fiber protein [Actinomycetota bacterium]